MSPNTFFHGKINIYLSKAPEERDLIQFAKNNGIERIEPECSLRITKCHFLPHGPITMANRVLIQFAHPALQKSRVNRRLIAAVQNLENVTINDLYEEYPDFFVDVQREQELLLSHDIIVFQHPFYWYSCPALVKQWEDLVLQYGFAFGAQGTSSTGNGF